MLGSSRNFQDLPTQEYLKSILHYNPETGIFTWKIKFSRSIKIGNKAGYLNKGYIRIGINKTKHFAHRLAWVYINGGNLNLEIDHINRDRSDNRICNLRAVNSSINNQNKTIGKNNKSGYQGVSWNKQARKWRAYIGQKGKSLYLGEFNNLIDAVYARELAKINLEFNK